ncbi:MAG: hypothetical protein HQ553_02205 [Chloroflexi bacterium]|nr:hypothetical protein [Chloroflexota bacterium]
MKKIVVMVGLVLVLALAGVVGCGGDGGDTLSPEDTCRKSLEALGNEDYDKSFSYWVKDEETMKDVERAKTMLKDASIEVSNIETTLISESSDEAVVKVTYDMEMDWMGEVDKYSEEDTMNLVKVDGKWLIESNEGD